MYDNFLKAIIGLSIFLSGILGIRGEVYAQQEEIDSLNALLPEVRGRQRYEVLYSLARIHAEKNYDLALSYAQQAKEVALSTGDSLGLVKASRAIGNIYYKKSDLEAAIQHYKPVLGVARRNQYIDQLKFLLNGLALAYTYQANYDNALEYHFQSLVIREAEGNPREISITYNNIGLVYYKLRDFQQALDYFLRSLEIKREANDYYDIDYCLINIGLCYNALDQNSKAIQYLNEALTYCQDRCTPERLNQIYYTLGSANLGLGNLEEAYRHFLTSYDIAIEEENKRWEAENLYGLYMVSVRMRDDDRAIQFLQQAEAILESLDYTELRISVFGAFADLYASRRDFEKASAYQDKYINLKDSVYSEKLISNLAKIKTNFEERQNIAIIASKNEALIRQQRFNIAIVIIAVLAGLLVFVLYRSNLVKKRVNQALSDAKVTIEDQNRQLTSLNRNLERMVDARTIELQVANEALKRVNDELDNFIYKTSHDIRGPLASLKGMCNVAIMDVKDPLALDYFNKLDATAEKLNTILTRLLIINQINNSSASHELIDFEEIVDDVIVLERKRGLPPRLTIKKEIEENIIFYSDKELIRIILENLIDNAIKFYNDSDRADPFVMIKVERDGNTLKVRVIDNGIGISQVNPDKIFQMFSRASERSGTGGIGLYLTKTATEKIGGQIDLKTTPEGYTEFFVKFSLTTSRMRAEVAV
ncbi:MAG TPA: tetratricopeptide repeat-containing sensor histidine kinase [Cyclobacteriaceae bacterium]